MSKFLTTCSKTGGFLPKYLWASYYNICHIKCCVSLHAISRDWSLFKLVGSKNSVFTHYAGVFLFFCYIYNTIYLIYFQILKFSNLLDFLILLQFKSCFLWKYDLISTNLTFLQFNFLNFCILNFFLILPKFSN